LRPSLQGYRLVGGEYVPIESTGDRLRSELLGLDLGRLGEELRLFDPKTGLRLPTRREGNLQSKAEAEQARAEARQAKAQAGRAETRAQRAEAEQERLRREVEELRRRLGGGA
jgi:acyl-CoA reductase-like NAD-dependent aldehyde dehydrogenase